MNWVGASRHWKVSGLELPRVELAADAALQRWCVVAGGLGLILSRIGGPERSARFAHTAALYALVRHRLRRSQQVCASASLLGEVMHEVAETADPLTRSCLKACFQDSLGAPATDGDRAQAQAQASSTPSPLTSAPLPSSQASAAQRAADTSFNTQMLLERSRALRRSVAAARQSSGNSQESATPMHAVVSAA